MVPATLVLELGVEAVLAVNLPFARHVIRTQLFPFVPVLLLLAAARTLRQVG